MTKLFEVLLAGSDDDIALLSESEALTFRSLRQRVQVYAQSLFGADHKQLAFCFLPNTLDLAVIYLSGIASANAVGLFAPSVPYAHKCQLIEMYRPDIVADAGLELAHFMRGLGYLRVHALSLHGDCVVWRRKSDEVRSPDLALLLSTSGSTGSPKLVRLSYGNIAASALSIVAGLGISSARSAVTSLPLYSSYGLSILNSHLAAGSVVAVTDLSPLTSKFWHFAHRHDVVEIGGTTMLYRAIFRRGSPVFLPPMMTVMTHAGSRLPLELARPALKCMQSVNGSFFCMYGQTEATSRISCFDAVLSPDKLGSAGTAVPGGRLRIDSPEGAISYTGPNVMMGYARCLSDLARGHDVETLDTGDIGKMDADGFLYVTSRSSRFTKILDRRVSLDDIEEWLASSDTPCAALAVPHSAGSVVVFTTELTDHIKSRRNELTKALSAPESSIELRLVDALPVTRNGKIDYVELGNAIR